MGYTYHLYLDGVQLPMPDESESVVLNNGRALRAAGVAGKLEYRCAQPDLTTGNRYPFWPIPNPRNADALRAPGQALVAQYNIRRWVPVADVPAPVVTRSLPAAAGGTRVASVASAHTLSSYFETADQQRRALNAFFDAWGGTWSLSKELLDTYEASQVAFDPSASAGDAFRHFQIIYDELASSRWNVFRPHGRESCWPPRQIFETVKREFSELSWLGPVNLLNFPKTAPSLESCLRKMRGIKPNQEYPVMTVSKFLHFYNPGLFPIYDTAMIWEKVFKRFDNDFRGFCWTAGIPYDSAIKDGTAAFLRYYMLWANSLLKVAHPTFMAVFTDWLGKQPGAELSKRRIDPTSLYAAAFEITAIGATRASQSASAR
jgi:hypothetical protein